MTPSAARIDLQTHAYSACKPALMAMPGASEGREPWFNMEFASAKIPRDVMERWEAATPSSDVALPPRNEYIPSDFSLLCDSMPSGAAANGTKNSSANASDPVNGAAAAAITALFPSPPSLLADASGMRVWHKLDSSFRVPKAVATFRLAHRAVYGSPRAAALAHLATKLLEDELCEITYLADVAGLQYALWFEGTHGELCFLAFPPPSCC
jgi:secreted Zn-dependent insulinase-like peptidase